jgi:hypothetical protein
MAIEFNDNIHVKINRPTDFRFGPFTDITQANATIPIAQRYHGLIFGVYTTPLSIATSDVKFYYYWDGLTNTDIKELGGKPPVDGSYANQAAMIAAQATQTPKYLYYDGTSYWEYLGTTNGNITDYRTLSSYQEASHRESNTILFDNDYVTGINSSARTGNILFDFTGAKLAACTVMKHQDSGTFTFPAEAMLMFDTVDISTTVANYFMFSIVKTTATQIVHVFHAIEGGV